MYGMPMRHGDMAPELQNRGAERRLFPGAIGRELEEEALAQERDEKRQQILYAGKAASWAAYKSKDQQGKHQEAGTGGGSGGGAQNEIPEGSIKVARANFWRDPQYDYLYLMAWTAPGGEWKTLGRNFLTA
eukprot:14204614-Heterocapsa_arctica.AAC.1